MYQYYLDTYERFCNETTNVTNKQAYMDVLASLNTHNIVQNLDAVRSDVRTFYNSAIAEYHAATTDYGKGKAGQKIDVYSFFLELSK